MPPRKDKNKIIHECETSAAANKRMRTHILNRTSGVPFTSPFTQFPSRHMLRPQRNNTTAVTTDLRLSPPSPYRLPEVAPPDFISALIPQHNFIINYHINVMVQSVEDFWRRTVAGEFEKRKEMERRLKDKEEQVDFLRQLYKHYEEKTFCLENGIGQPRFAGEGSGVAPAEDVQSNYVDLNRGERRVVITCRNCSSRPATMLWLPCRHLCVCVVCERRLKNCPICRVKKTQSLQIDLP